MHSDDGVAAPQDRLIAQITRLQERQRELIIQTADELESVKHELEQQVEHIKQPLEDEVALLRRELQHLLTEREGLRQQLYSIHSSIGTVLQLQSSPPAHTSQPHIAQPAHGVHVRPLVVRAIPIAPTPPKEKEVVKESPKPLKMANVEKEPKPKKEPSARPKHVKHILRRALLTCLLGAVGYAGLLGTQHLAFNTAPASQVAGASTVASPSASPDPAQAVVTFRDTLWDTSIQPDFNISFDLPRNASDLSGVPGGSNLWVVRLDSYLFKASRTDAPSTQTLDQYYDTIKDQYKEGFSTSRTNFKGMPAIVLTTNPVTTISGTTTIVSYKGQFLTFWFKDQPPTTDDGQRIARMIASLKFL